MPTGTAAMTGAATPGPPRPCGSTRPDEGEGERGDRMDGWMDGAGVCTPLPLSLPSPFSPALDVCVCVCVVCGCAFCKTKRGPHAWGVSPWLVAWGLRDDPPHSHVPTPESAAAAATPCAAPSSSPPPPSTAPPTPHPSCPRPPPVRCVGQEGARARPPARTPLLFLFRARAHSKNTLSLPNQLLLPSRPAQPQRAFRPPVTRQDPLLPVGHHRRAVVAARTRTRRGPTPAARRPRPCPRPHPRPSSPPRPSPCRPRSSSKPTSAGWPSATLRWSPPRTSPSRPA